MSGEKKKVQWRPPRKVAKKPNCYSDLPKVSLDAMAMFANAPDTPEQCIRELEFLDSMVDGVIETMQVLRTRWHEKVDALPVIVEMIKPIGHILANMQTAIEKSVTDEDDDEDFLAGEEDEEEEEEEVVPKTK